MELLKYPRTHHIQGSKYQNGDEDLESVPFSVIAGRTLVIEEKVDGANCAISYDSHGKQMLQSRGHYLVGGPREKHFTLLKQWAAANSAALHEVLGDRYICFGEWLFAKHTIFYDLLPHYFMEFDVYDRKCNSFLSTARRRTLLSSLQVESVRVLFKGKLTQSKAMEALIGPSAFISDKHRENLRTQSRKHGLDEERAVKETENSRMMEGLYIKVEEAGIVKERYKFVRSGFLSAVLESESHWLNRPILPNILANASEIG